MKVRAKSYWNRDELLPGLFDFGSKCQEEFDWCGAFLASSPNMELRPNLIRLDYLAFSNARH